MPFQCRVDASAITMTWVKNPLLQGESLAERLNENKAVKNLYLRAIPADQLPALLAVLKESMPGFAKIQLDKQVVGKLEELLQGDKDIPEGLYQQLIVPKKRACDCVAFFSEKVQTFAAEVELSAGKDEGSFFRLDT